MNPLALDPDHTEQLDDENKDTQVKEKNTTQKVHTPNQKSSTKNKKSAKNSIKAIGKGKWTIERRLVKKWQKRPSRFARGKMKKRGFKLQKVRDAKHCGLQKGDVILKVNGYKMSSVTQAMMAHAALKNAKKLRVVFRRAGKKMTYIYKIVK